MVEEPTALLGRVIAGKMLLEKFIGDGAMGWVFRAQHYTLKKPVAIKVLRRTWGSNPFLSERFAREAQTASRLGHPNSVAILDFGEDGEDSLLYIAMEFLDGEDLLAILSREWPLDVHRVCRLMMQMLAAISAAHELGIVHRDIKPANIMVLKQKDDDGALIDLVKVCDFGLAKILNFDGSHDGLQTVPGAVIGTPLYMSPEQATGDLLGPPTDVYSCGVILYQMLTGHLPFTAETNMQVLMKHVSEKPPPMETFRPGLPPRLASAAYWALEKDPEKRPTARELRKALREISEGANPVIPRSLSGTTGSLTIPADGGSSTDGVPLPESAFITIDPIRFDQDVIPAGISAILPPHARQANASEPASLGTGDLFDAIVDSVNEVAPVRTPERGEVGTVVRGVQYGGSRAVPSRDLKAYLWNQYSLIADLYEGSDPFFIRDHSSVELGPLSWSEVSQIFQRCCETRNVANVFLSIDGKSWMPGTQFSKLSGQEGIATVAEPWSVDRKSPIAGALESASITALWGRIARERPTGRVLLRTEDRSHEIRAEIHVVKGKPTFIQHSDARFQVPQLLVQLKVVTEQLIPRLLSKVIREERPLADVVARETQLDVAPYLRSMMRERMFEIFQWRRGTYHFDVQMPSSATPMAPSLLSFLPDMISRGFPIEDLRAYVSKYGRRRLERSERFNELLGEMKPSAAQIEILRRFGGHMTVGEAVALQSPERLYLAWAYLLIETELLRR